METDSGEERTGSSGEDLHLSVEKKPMENASFSMSRCNEPRGYFTYLALALLLRSGRVARFQSGTFRWKECSRSSPYIMKTAHVTYLFI